MPSYELKSKVYHHTFVVGQLPIYFMQLEKLRIFAVLVRFTDPFESLK